MAKRSSEISNLNENICEDFNPKKLKDDSCCQEESECVNNPPDLTLNNNGTNSEGDLELRENNQDNDQLSKTNGSSPVSFLTENPLLPKEENSDPQSSNENNSESISSPGKDESEKQNVNELDKMNISGNGEEELKPPEDTINPISSRVDGETSSPQTPSTSNNDEKQNEIQQLDATNINKTKEELKPKKEDTNKNAVQTTDSNNPPQQPSSNTTRETCFYYRRCFRKNPQHKREYAHPGDDDYVSDKDDQRPQCKYGTKCYRKGTQHKKDFKHSNQRPRQATPRNTYMPGSSEDELDEFDDIDDFLNDDSDEYQPSDSFSDQDMEEGDEEDENKKQMKAKNALMKKK